MDKQTITSILHTLDAKLRWAKFHNKCDETAQTKQMLREIKELLEAVSLK